MRRSYLGVISKQALLFLAVSAFLTLGITEASKVFGQFTTRKSQPVRQVIPKLEVQMSSELGLWATEIVIYEPADLLVRWGQPISSNRAQWYLSNEPFPTDSILKSGSITAQQANDKFHIFHVNLKGVLPGTPPPASSPTELYLRVVPRGTNLAATRAVKISYQAYSGDTEFTAAGLHPELFEPMPIFINLQTFTIHKADEEDDEEPYIMAVVLYFDGTTISVKDIPLSSVRMDSSKSTHGNIPQYNSSIGSGDVISIPPETGYFEKSILPISMSLADTNFFGVDLDYTHLTKATMVWVLVLALEEDNTGTESADAARAAFVKGLEDSLNACISSLTLPEVIRLVRDGSNLQAILMKDDTTICGYTASGEDGSVLDQIRARLVQLAQDAAMGEELDNAQNWLPGGGLFILHQLANPDDVIGFDFRGYTYDKLWNSPRPVKFTLDFDIKQPGSYPSASANKVHYSIQGSIGRCRKVPGKSRCVPIYPRPKFKSK